MPSASIATPNPSVPLPFVDQAHPVTTPLLPTTPQEPLTPIVLSQRKQPITRKHLMLTGIALLLLIMASIGTYYPLTWHTAALQQQATDATQVQPTIEVQATATASTATNAYNAYNAYVAANGMMFGFNAQHTHFNPYEKILSPATVTGLVQDWTATGSYIGSSPAVANGIVYVGSFDHKLYAFHLTDTTPYMR